MPTRRLLALSVLLVSLSPFAASLPLAHAASNTWYVAPGGDNGNDCLSDLTPCRTIQAAINKATANDFILIAAGTYSPIGNGETFPITLNKTIIFHGASMSTTIIDAANSALDVFSVEGYISLYLDGVTIQGGNHGLALNGYGAAGMHGIISDNTITTNVYGIDATWFSGSIENNDISGNTHSGILTLYGSPEIGRNIFGFNGSGLGDDAAIHNDHSSPTIVNNLMGWNNGSGVFNTHASPTITNNTISINYGGCGIANFDSSSPTVTNNIITANAVYGIHADATSSSTSTYNDVWANGWGDYFGTSGGAGSISANPMFVTILDAHLLCSSPAINHGNNAAPGVPGIDYDDNPRPVGGTVDMGAYEWQSPFLCAVCLPLVIR